MEGHNWKRESEIVNPWRRLVTDWVPDMKVVDKILYSGIAVHRSHYGEDIKEGSEYIPRMVEAMRTALLEDDDLIALSKIMELNLEDQVSLFDKHLSGYITPRLLNDYGGQTPFDEELHDSAKELYKRIRDLFIDYMAADVDPALLPEEDSDHSDSQLWY